MICEVIVRSDLRTRTCGRSSRAASALPGVDPARCERSSLFVAAYPFPPLLGSDPIRVLISSIVRKAPRSVGAHVKSLNYLDAVLAKRQANAAGMQEAIMLDHLGAVAECSAANVFAVFDGDARHADDALGAPRDHAADDSRARRGAGDPDRGAGHLADGALRSADALFATGSGAGIVPIAGSTACPCATAGNPVAAALAEGYRARTRDPRFLLPVRERIAR